MAKAIKYTKTSKKKFSAWVTKPKVGTKANKQGLVTTKEKPWVLYTPAGVETVSLRTLVGEYLLRTGVGDVNITEEEIKKRADGGVVPWIHVVHKTQNKVTYYARHIGKGLGKFEVYEESKGEGSKYTVAGTAFVRMYSLVGDLRGIASQEDINKTLYKPERELAIKEVRSKESVKPEVASPKVASKEEVKVIKKEEEKDLIAAVVLAAETTLKGTGAETELTGAKGSKKVLRCKYAKGKKVISIYARVVKVSGEAKADVAIYLKPKGKEQIVKSKKGLPIPEVKQYIVSEVSKTKEKVSGADTSKKSLEVEAKVENESVKLQEQGELARAILNTEARKFIEEYGIYGEIVEEHRGTREEIQEACRRSRVKLIEWHFKKNKDIRFREPAICHSIQLGYTYEGDCLELSIIDPSEYEDTLLPMDNAKWEEDYTNTILKALICISRDLTNPYGSKLDANTCNDTPTQRVLEKTTATRIKDPKGLTETQKVARQYIRAKALIEEAHKDFLGYTGLIRGKDMEYTGDVEGLVGKPHLGTTKMFSWHYKRDKEHVYLDDINCPNLRMYLTWEGKLKLRSTMWGVDSYEIPAISDPRWEAKLIENLLEMLESIRDGMSGVYKEDRHSNFAEYLFASEKEKEQELIAKQERNDTYWAERYGCPYFSKLMDILYELKPSINEILDTREGVVISSTRNSDTGANMAQVTIEDKEYRVTCKKLEGSGMGAEGDFTLWVKTKPLARFRTAKGVCTRLLNEVSKQVSDGKKHEYKYKLVGKFMENGEHMYIVQNLKTNKKTKVTRSQLLVLLKSKTVNNATVTTRNGSEEIRLKAKGGLTKVDGSSLKRAQEGLSESWDLDNERVHRSIMDKLGRSIGIVGELTPIGDEDKHSIFEIQAITGETLEVVFSTKAWRYLITSDRDDTKSLGVRSREDRKTRVKFTTDLLNGILSKVK